MKWEGNRTSDNVEDRRRGGGGGGRGKGGIGVGTIVIALLGGYASPVLLSTGENRPDAFFPYLFVLSLVAFGTSLAMTGSPVGAMKVFFVFYVVCVLVTWLVYGRRKPA